MQSLLKRLYVDSQRRLLLMVIAQINLLICILSDIMDCRLIEKGYFKKRRENFNPVESIKFIVSMLTSHAEVHNTSLNYRALKAPLTPNSQLELFL